MTNVYITDLARFLPNEPIGNDELERLLGTVDGRPSRTRALTLRNNGIKTRHYAIDPRTGAPTHTNAQLAAAAIRAVLERGRVEPEQIDILSCGTSCADQLVPAHAHMVHGELGFGPCEVVATAGVCSSGISALKYAYANLSAGLAHVAVSTGSEQVSSLMRGRHFAPELAAQVESLASRPELAFEKDFLRWMLSDGAGAALLLTEPNVERLSLRIDWIDCLSFAGEMPVCMYAGAVKDAQGRLRGWRDVENVADIAAQGYLALKQDSRMLGEHILPISVQRALLPIAARRRLDPSVVDWFLPHYSSEYFRQRLYDTLAANGFEIPIERWVTNLTTVGNIGSAAMYLILEELLYSGRLTRGDRLLCYIPESGRFTICYMHLTVV